MTQEQIAKLQELKQLLDAGILTQEEMQVEKAKVLGTQPSQPKEGNRIIEDSSKVIEEVSPVGTDVDDHLVYEAPKKNIARHSIFQDILCQAGNQLEKDIDSYCNRYWDWRDYTCFKEYIK